jgi:hypothetical protein
MDDSMVHTHCTHWIQAAADAQSKYVMLTAFPPQQWLHEGASILHYMYSPDLVVSCPYLDNLNLHIQLANSKLRNSKIPFV